MIACQRPPPDEGNHVGRRAVPLEEDFFEVTQAPPSLVTRPARGRTRTGPGVQEIHEQTQKETLAELQPRISPGDVVVLHDHRPSGSLLS